MTHRGRERGTAARTRRTTSIVVLLALVAAGGIDAQASALPTPAHATAPAHLDRAVTSPPATRSYQFSRIAGSKSGSGSRRSSKAAPIHVEKPASRPTNGPTTYSETTGGLAHTWTNYTNAGGYPGATIASNVTVQIACRLTGFVVPDGNPWWYQIASSPWNYAYYVSADPFYNNGQTTGPLKGTPDVDPNVTICGSGGGHNETTGGVAHTFTDYSDAGGTQGPSIGSNATVQIACAITGYKVQDGNTWWYEVASAPWDSAFYVSADAFYNNGETSGTLLGTPFVDPSVPLCSGGAVTGGGLNETTGGPASTWSDYADAGGTPGPSLATHTTLQVACKVTGYRVQDGNVWWYQIASSPWDNEYYVTADAFYNNGETSGDLATSLFVDTAVPDCSTGSRPGFETVGSNAGTWSNYSDGGGVAGQTIPQYDTVAITCRITGLPVQNGNTWWYQIASSPWNDNFYASADAFYNDGATSGSLSGTPYYDPAVPICSGGQEAPQYTSAVATSQASHNTTSCPSGQDPVDCASGDFWHTFTDVSIPGRGPNLDLTRTYNDLDAGVLGIFGYGWSSSYDQHLTVNADGSITATLADGSQFVAEPGGSGSYAVPASADASLVQNGDLTFTLTLKQTQFLTFSSTGQLLSLHDLNGYTTTLAYTASGQLASVTDAAGRELNFTIGSNGLIASVVDPLGRTTSYAYDGSDDLTSVTDALGRTWTFTYDGSHRVLTMTDPRGGVVANVYNSTGQVTAQTDPAGLTTTYSYTGDNFSSLGGTTTITDPHGSVEFEQYADGFVTTVTKANGTAAQGTWSYVYDPATFGITMATDPNGNVTQHTYDAAGNVLTTIDPLTFATSYTYNAFEELLTTTTPLGEVSSKTYDGNGNILTSTDAVGKTTTYAYGDSSHPGDITSITDPDGRVTSFTYDSDGDVASKSVSPTSGITDTTTFVYDIDGEQVCEASANATAASIACPSPGSPRVTGTTTTVYNADGEITAVTDPNGDTTQTVYDADGNVGSVTDPMGNVTASTYDHDNRLLSSVSGANGAAPATTSYAYDLAPGTGSCAAISAALYCQTTTNPSGAVTVDTYDARDDKIQEILPGGETTSYGYDVDGNKTTMTDADARVTTYAYDPDNRLTSITYSDGATPNVSYTYTNDGERASMTDGTGTTSYLYDADQRVTSITNGADAVVGYTYDGNGDITSMAYPNGERAIRTYDGAGRLTSVSDWLGNTTTFAYDGDGNLTRTTYSDGDVVTSTYNADDALTATSVAGSGGSLASLTYTRDADGRVTEEVRAGAVTGSTAYSYNANAQLSAAGAVAFSYDPNGNLVDKGTTAQTFNSANEMTSAGITTYGYDAIGDRTSLLQPTGAGTDYSYDQAARLTSVTQLVVSPTVTSISPVTGPAVGGTTVTVTGYGFTGATAVSFGGVAATSFTVVSDTQIRAVAPAGAGTVDVIVTTPYGGSTAVAGDEYTYVSAPAVSGVTPSVGPTTGGTAVTLTGAGFSGATAVSFGTVAASPFNVVSTDEITVTAPAHASGSVNVIVTTPGGKSASGPSDEFTYGTPPAVTSISPTSGPVTGGTLVTITGARFTSPLTVAFGSVAGTGVKRLSSTKVQAVAPSQASGPVQVSVTTAEGASPAVPLDVFTYLAPPVVTGLSPTSGLTKGGTTVTINGSGFTGATKVVFGTANAAHFTVVSASQITAVSPAHAKGTVNVVVTTPVGKSVTGTASQFTFATKVKIVAESIRSAATTSVVVASYTYNGDGLRMSETTASGVASFTWDTTPSVPELLTDGTSYYIYGPGGLPIEQINGSAVPSYFFHDSEGSTIALLTSTGSVGATFTFGAYGAETFSTGTLTTPLLYAQTYSDAATGLYYAINRYYDPTTGQFLSVDPDLSASRQAYEYAADDPVNSGDPLGLIDLNPLSYWRFIVQTSIAVGTTVAVVAAGTICTAVTFGACGPVAVGVTVLTIGAVSGIASYAVGGGNLTVQGFAENGLIGAFTAPLGAKAGFVADLILDWYNDSGQAGSYGGNSSSGSHPSCALQPAGSGSLGSPVGANALQNTVGANYLQ